jgi:NADPH:quinone reductase-like Zn-dependent oxidoreductase
MKAFVSRMLSGIDSLAIEEVPAPSGVDITPVKVGSRDNFEALNHAVAFHKSRPVIAARYTFEQLPEALRHLHSGRHMGKIVIGFD